MANPFRTKFDSQCMNCEDMLDQGDLMYAMSQLFICPACAVEAGVVCNCGNFKKAEYKKCYTCSQDRPVDIIKEEDEWNPWAEPKKKDDSLPF